MIRYNEKIDGNEVDGFEILGSWIERHCMAEEHRKIQVLDFKGGVYSLSEVTVDDDDDSEDIEHRNANYTWNFYRTVSDLIQGADCKNGTDFFFGTQFCEITVHGSMWTYVNDPKSGGQNTRIIRIQ